MQAEDTPLVRTRCHWILDKGTGKNYTAKFSKCFPTPREPDKAAWDGARLAESPGEVEFAGAQHPPSDQGGHFGECR
jgi:hypothetical protein